MRGYALTHYFPAHAVQLYERAVKLVESIPEPADVDSIRCHELARAVRMELWPIGVTSVVDGKYGGVDHSWLLIGIAYKHSVILDVYSVAHTPMVQLVDTQEYPVWLSPLYRPGPFRTDIDETKVIALINGWASL